MWQSLADATEKVCGEREPFRIPAEWDGLPWYQVLDLLATRVADALDGRALAAAEARIASLETENVALEKALSALEKLVRDDH